MKTRFLTISTSFSLIFLCWIFLHAIQVSKDCLNSPIVAKLSFQTLNGDIIRVLSCEATSYLRFWKVSYLNNRHRSLEKRISALTRVKMLGLSSKVDPIQVLVTEKDPYYFNWHGETLQLGWSWAESQGLLERALLKEWLKKQNPLISRDQFQAEVLSYLALGFLKDQLIVQDIFSGESIDLSENRSWLRWVLSLDDYCNSPWITFDYQSLCQQENQLSPKVRANLGSLDKIEKMALAPLVASLLWRRYRVAELSEKKTFWDGLKMSLSDPETFSYRQTQEMENLQHLEEVREWVNGMTSLYWLSLGFNSNIGQGNWLSEKLDVLVEASEMPFTRLVEVINLANSKPELNIVVRSGEKMFVGSLSGLSLSSDGLGSQYHLLSGCGAIKKHSLKRVIESRIIILDFCRSKGKINWQPLVADGWEAFIVENPSMKFVGLFMPSVKKFSSWPDILHIRDKDMKELGKKLGWKYQVWDKRLAVYRPKGVWDAVLFYRQ